MNIRILGQVVVVIPYQKLPIVIEALKEMTWYRESLSYSRDNYVKWDADLTKRTQEESQSW